MSKVLNFKVVLLGEVGVGKTSIFVRLRDNKFIGSKSTIGVDKGEFEFEVNGTPVKLDLWDTAGSEKFRTLTSNYYHGAKACIYIYDITDTSSLYSLAAWLLDAQKFAKDHLCFLVANKCDMEEEIDVEKQTAETFQREKGFIERFEMSAKTGAGVRDAFQAIAEHLVKKLAPGSDSLTSEQAMQPSPFDNVGAQSKSKGCCS